MPCIGVAPVRWVFPCTPVHGAQAAMGQCPDCISPIYPIYPSAPFQQQVPTARNSKCWQNSARVLAPVCRAELRQLYGVLHRSAAVANVRPHQYYWSLLCMQRWGPAARPPSPLVSAANGRIPYHLFHLPRDECPLAQLQVQLQHATQTCRHVCAPGSHTTQVPRSTLQPTTTRSGPLM